MMKLRLLILLCLALGVFMPSPVFANGAVISEPFNETPPSEVYLKEMDDSEKNKPSLRWAAPEEDGDGFDQKVPLGELTFLNILGIVGLCVVYSMRQRKSKIRNA